MPLRSSLHRLIIVSLKITLFAALVCLVDWRPVTAGSAPGVITCKSAGRTGVAVTLSGQLPGDYEIFDLKIKSGKEERAIRSLETIDRDTDPDERNKLEESGVIAKGRVITVVEDFRRGVFSIALRRPEGYDLRLYALPGTIRPRITPNSKKATFDAMLLEGDSDVYPNWNKATRMRCTFDHSI
jgi:hypothetical protein